MRHIPNILSVFRILLIPLFVWQMLEDKLLAAALILAASGLTDLLDGFLARRFNWVSDLGKVLDPAADKLTQVTVCVVLIIKWPRYWYFFALLLLKEVVMLTLGGWLLKKGIHLSGARWFGKIVTTLFYLTTVVIIFFPNIPHYVIIALLSLLTVCAFVAGILYIPQFLGYKREVKQGAPNEAGARQDTAADAR